MPFTSYKHGITADSVDPTGDAGLAINDNLKTIADHFDITLNNQSPNLVFAGPASGGSAAPTFRALVTADLPGGGSGTVTSVDLTMPTEFSVSGNPITNSGTLAVSKATQSANLVYAGPTTGSAAQPTFRSLVAADVPTLNQNTTGTAGGLSATLAIGSGGTGQTTQQAAMDALAGAQSSGKYLRSDGTHTTLTTIQAGDVPTLNQNTTGTAGGLSANISESQVTSLVSDLAARVPTTRTVSTSGSLSGGGALSGDLTLSLTTTTPMRVTYDGGGSVISSGSGTKVYAQVPVSGTIVSNTLLADQSGSVVIGIKKCSYSGFPGSLTSIVASAPPTLSSAQKSTDSTLSGWTVSVTAGDVLEYSVTSATTVTRVCLVLEIQGS